MATECEYCAENYDSDRRVPLMLSCGHTFCKECVQFLINSQVSKVCPFDNKVVDFTTYTIDYEVLKRVENQCETHSKQINALCTKHFVKLCEDCRVSHADCSIFCGSLQELDEKLNAIINKAIVKNSEKFCSHILNTEAFANWRIWLQEEYDEFQQANKLLSIDTSAFEELNEEKKIELIRNTEFIKSISPSEITERNSKINPMGACNSPNKKNVKDSDVSEKIRESVALVKSEIDRVRCQENCLRYFALSFESIYQDDLYQAVFYNETSNHLQVLGIGAGLPVSPGYNVCFFFSISSEIGEIIYQSDYEILNYEKDCLTKTLPINPPISLKHGSGIIIAVEASGGKIYTFCRVCTGNLIKVLEVGGLEFKSEIPILYLSI